MNCEFCMEETTETVEIYDPVGFVSFDTCHICEDCRENLTEDCRTCGKHIYSDDLPFSAWHKSIPYDKDFDSDAERYRVISGMEKNFYCNDCMPKTGVRYKEDYIYHKNGYRNCKNCIGEPSEYTIRDKTQGGRFFYVSADESICFACYDKLPESMPK